MDTNQAPLFPSKFHCLFCQFEELFGGICCNYQLASRKSSPHLSTLEESLIEVVQVLGLRFEMKLLLHLPFNKNKLRHILTEQPVRKILHITGTTQVKDGRFKPLYYHFICIAIP